jgi:hypothetical protein
VLNNRVIDNALVAVGINPGWTVHLSGNELSRKGGLPPIVMVFAGSDATFADNVIRGEGVAGIRVAGVVRADRNSFPGLTLRKVGPPNFAVWALEGAKVTLTDNSFSTWRHALHATKAEVIVRDNKINDFHQSAFVINSPSKPPVIAGNVAVSSDRKAQVGMLDGKPVDAGDNRVEPPTPGGPQR